MANPVGTRFLAPYELIVLRRLPGGRPARAAGRKPATAARPGYYDPRYGAASVAAPAARQDVDLRS